jgi:hypothetical protein
MIRDKSIQKADVGRLSWLVNQSIRPEEQGKTFGLIGALMGGENPTRAYLERVTTPDRDMLLFTERRLLVFSPKPVSRVKLMDMLRYKLGDRTAILDHEESIARRQVKRVTLSQEAPSNFNMTDLGDAAMTFARVEVNESSGPKVIDFWVDTDVQNPERLARVQESLNQYFGHTALST